MPPVRAEPGACRQINAVARIIYEQMHHAAVSQAVSFFMNNPGYASSFNIPRPQYARDLWMNSDGVWELVLDPGCNRHCPRRDRFGHAAGSVSSYFF